MIKAVIFDFDHTLYDRKKTIVAATPAMFRRLAPYLRKDVSLTEFAAAFYAVETDPDLHAGSGYQGMIDKMEQMGLFNITPEKPQYLKAFYPSLSESIAMYPDAYNTLHRLKQQGFKLGLLTNGYSDIQRIKLSHTKVPDYMDALLIGGDLPHPKPHPEAFLAICRELKVRTDEAIYVGDQIYIDVCGAREAGMKTVWFPYVGTWPRDVAPPDFIIEKLSELPSILQQLTQEN